MLLGGEGVCSLKVGYMKKIYLKIFKEKNWGKIKSSKVCEIMWKFAIGWVSISAERWVSGGCNLEIEGEERSYYNNGPPLKLSPPPHTDDTYSLF